MAWILNDTLFIILFIYFIYYYIYFIYSILFIYFMYFIYLLVVAESGCVNTDCRYRLYFDDR